MRIFKNILMYFAISFIIMIVSDSLGSSFLLQFLKKDLLTILIALFGLNVAILSILISKLSDSKKKYPGLELREITHEMKLSLIEFIVLIAIALLCLILMGSEKFAFQFKDLTFSTLLLSTLIYSLVIIWDTGNSIFVLVQEEENKDDVQQP